MLEITYAPWGFCVRVCAREIESVYHRVCVSSTNYCTNVLRADLGKVLTENILDTRRKKKKGKTTLQEALDSSGLACDSSTFEAFFCLFFKCLIRQIKRTLSSLNICDHNSNVFLPRSGGD